MPSPVNGHISTSSTSPDDWKYVSEGGATIVFSYRGPPHPVFSGTVLRLRKARHELNIDVPWQPDSKAVVSSESVLAEGEEEEPDDPSILFQQKVTSRLIEPEFLPRLETVVVERTWLETLRVSSESDRPLERRTKDDIDVNRRKAVLATDLVGGDGWAVEIKPKWGFLPNTKYLSSETRENKSRHCRFCMHTQYRSGKGESASHDYCPLDLFSGIEERVVYALRCLWKAWITSNGTVNNLKIFARGELVVPQESSEKLRKFISGPSNGIEVDELMEGFVNTLLPLLTRTPVLQRIAHLQRSLDALDIEGLQSLHSIYAQAHFPDSPGTIAFLEDLFPDPSLDDWDHFVSAYKSQQLIANFDPEHLRHHAMAYLLSATFKDCSIMLHLGRNPGVPDSITVIDLDPKSMKRLRKWAELDHDIAVSFVDNGSRVCYDELLLTRANLG
ncbi:hypothetical protein ACEPAH_4544 [Sanghuangporus vaninii]